MYVPYRLLMEEEVPNNMALNLHIRVLDFAAEVAVNISKAVFIIVAALRYSLNILFIISNYSMTSRFIITALL